MIAGLRLLEAALPLLILSSPPDSLWAVSYGDYGRDYFTNAIENSHHEIVMVGQSNSCTAKDINGYMIKLDEAGDYLWSRCYGGPEVCGFQCASTTQNDDVMICGFTRCQGVGQRDGWLMRLDDSGEPLFDKTYGGAESDVMKFVLPMPGDVYYTCGNTRSVGAGDADFWFMKFNGKGDSLWGRTYGGVYYEDSHWIVPVTDGGFLLVGHTSSIGDGPYNGWIVRTDDDGDSLWSRYYGGHSVDMLYAGAETSDGGFVLAGHTDSKGAGNLDFWLIRTDSDGDTLWEKTYGGPGDEKCYSMKLCEDGGSLLFGETFSYGAGSSDFWLLKANAEGDSVWSKTFGGDKSETGLSLIARLDGSYLVGGSTESFSNTDLDFWLVQIASDSSDSRTLSDIYK